MPRATSIYFIMLAIFGSGLWLILSFGNVLLRAPTDLSGSWDLTTVDTESSQKMSVEQSGKYLRVELDKKTYDLKMTQDRKDAADGSPIELRGTDGTEMIFYNASDRGRQYSVRLAGAAAGTYRALRSTTQPSRSNAKH